MQPKEFSPEIPLTCGRILTHIIETNFRTSQFETQMQFIKQQLELSVGIKKKRHFSILM